MEKSNIVITIPEPCHEDWNKMLSNEKGLPTGQAGKFCNSCNKSVFDFSNKSDSEIKDILMAQKDQKVCGHFKKTQINRPLNIRIDLSNLPKNMSVTKMFTIALFITFGTFLFSCTDNLGKSVGEISIEQNIKPETKEKHEDAKALVGQMLATMPPDTMSKTEKNEDTVEGRMEITTHYETHVAGGISIQHDYVIEKILPIDSPIVDSPIVALPKPEEMIVGIMVYMPQEVDSVIPNKKLDSIVIEKKDDAETKDIKSDFIVYPNPTKGEFTIKYDLRKRSDVLVDIVDINGVTLRTVVNIQAQHNGKYQVPVNLSDLPNGIYFVSLTNEGKRKTQKVILQK
ncbi:MAG: T9SS type A sorting domain-containing protein [Bacteroidota bacterium]|nr:T9SS type A sorting domain-containing protein [Bacteroidota bacterium]